MKLKGPTWYEHENGTIYVEIAPGQSLTLDVALQTGKISAADHHRVKQEVIEFRRKRKGV